VSLRIKVLFQSLQLYDFHIYFWRTQSGAEVDFVLYKNENCIIPIEAKFRTMKNPVITRAFRSLIEAYQPRYGIFITKDFNAKLTVDHCEVHFISFLRIQKMFDLLRGLVE
jgi:predicted AAA+ superfamily ATPase